MLGTPETGKFYSLQALGRGHEEMIFGHVGHEEMIFDKDPASMNFLTSHMLLTQIPK